MFGLGWQELLVIFGVIGLIFGPRQLPKMAESLGKTMRIVRKDARDFQKEMDEDKSLIEDAKNDFAGLQKEAETIKNTVKAAASVK